MFEMNITGEIQNNKSLDVEWKLQESVQKLTGELKESEAIRKIIDEPEVWLEMFSREQERRFQELAKVRARQEEEWKSSSSESDDPRVQSGFQIAAPRVWVWSSSQMVEGN